MNNNLFSTNNVVKYIILTGLVYYFLKKIPTNPINNKDLLLILSVVAISVILCNCIGKSSERFTNENIITGNPSEIINTGQPVEVVNQTEIGCNFEISKIKSELNNLKKELELKSSEELNNNVIIKNYLDNLITELSNSKVLTSTEIQTIQTKLNSKLFTINEVIESLETLKKEIKLVTKHKPANSGLAINSGKSVVNVARVNKSTGMLIGQDEDFDNINEDEKQSVEESTEEKVIEKEPTKVVEEEKPDIKQNPPIVQNDFIYNELPSDFFNPIGDKIANEWDNEFTLLNTDKWRVPMQRPPLCISSSPNTVYPYESGYFPVRLRNWDDSRYVTRTEINKKWANSQSGVEVVSTKEKSN